MVRMGERRGEVNNGFCWGDLRERDQLEDLGVEGNILKNWAGETWTGLIWLKDRWRALVNAVMNFRVP